MEPRPFTRQILLFILLEGLYIWLTRLLIGMGDPNGYTVESWRTLLRLVSAGLMAWVFRDLIKEFLKERVPSVTPPVSYLLPAIALFLAMLVPIAAGNWNLPTEGQRWFFAVTAFPVGLREEIVYRAILLVLLARAFGLSIAVVLSTLAFAVYHYGAQPWTVFTVTQYIFFGLAQPQPLAHHLDSHHLRCPLVLLTFPGKSPADSGNHPYLVRQHAPRPGLDNLLEIS